MEIRIGCSGFSYKHWKELLYPQKLPASQWLEYYAQHFNTLEINNTFYGFPKEKNLKSWYDRTPEDFMFTIKAHRSFTHHKKLLIDNEFLQQLNEFQRIVKVMGKKLGCVLWQLPGSLHKDLVCLRNFGKNLDHTMRHIVEFRHKSWFDDDTFNVMHELGLGFCMVSAPSLPEVVVSTSPNAYVRFHGKKSWYNYHYSQDELTLWKHRLAGLSGVEQLYVYFNNDFHAHAIENSRSLKVLLNV
jgi:uncharacterized protein YecE (DUF72 family)